jgi:aldose 1-epimerase
VQYRPVSAPDTILHAGDATVTVCASAGARIGQITVAGQPLLVDVPPPSDRHPLTWGCYPMAPWVGRIRGGRFTFGGVERRLPLNHRDGDGGPGRVHAIHGLVFDRAWPAAERMTTTSWSGTCPLDWAFGGTVTQTVELLPDRLTLTATISSTGGEFPAEVGWHPWFRKPDRLAFDPTTMYERDRFGLPTGALVAPSRGPWDDCFVASGPITLHYDRPAAPAVTIDADVDHWVVFDEPPDATCVEPQSGPPDAFNLTPHLVTPDTPLTRHTTISW